MIRLDQVPKLRAPEGYALLLKDTPSVMKAGLWMPIGIRETTRTATGTILDASASIGLQKGKRYLLSGGAGRRFLAGLYASEEVEIVRISLGDLLMELDEEVSPDLLGEHFGRLFEGKSGLRAEEDDGRFDEGDTDGLR